MEACKFPGNKSKIMFVTHTVMPPCFVNTDYNFSLPEGGVEGRLVPIMLIFLPIILFYYSPTGTDYSTRNILF